MREKCVVLVVDAQGGGLGRQLIINIRKELPEMHIIAGKKADFIIGPIGMIIADAMLGEITPGIATSIAQAHAIRILIPFSNCDNYIAGVSDFSMSSLIEDAIHQLKKHLTDSV